MTNAASGGDGFDKPVDYIGDEDDPATTPPTPNKHIYDDQHPGLRRHGPRVRRPAQGSVRRQPRRDLRPGQHQVSGDRAQSAAPNSRRPIARRRERHVARPRGADRLPDRSGKGPIIGGWTTASVRRRRASRRSRRPAASTATSQDGDFVQVSRLGMPLVNEVVIGLKDKNRFNASEPKDDGQFADYVTNPTLPALLEIAVRRGRRQGADQLPAHRPGRRVPDRHRGRQPAGQRRARPRCCG